MEKLKITKILEEKAIATAMAMSSEESQRRIEGTPFVISRRICGAEGVLYVDKLTIEGEDFCIYQQM